jgi:methionyl aminopeptidase
VSASESAPAGKSITIKSRDEILFMEEANQIVAEILVMLQKTVAPGISTYELDRLAEDLCTKRKAKPAFKGYRGFPGSLCVSINEEVVHGIPSRRRKLKKGDIISVDFGTLYNGYYGDSAVTIPVGRVDNTKHKLLTVTEESLSKAIEQVKVGNRIADISAAVQQCVEINGFTVVRQFV